MVVGNELERMPTISAVEPDWSREQIRAWWDPGRRLLRTIRQYQRWQGRRGVLARLVRAWIVLRHHLWQVVSGADIPPGTNLGGGLVLPHPNGIVIYDKAVIGPNCLIFQQVTIGTRGGRDDRDDGPATAGRGMQAEPCARNAGSAGPIIGGHVDIGAGAKILGPVRIGDHARIGANAVVLDDVPAYGVAVGVPARIVSGR